MCFTQNNNDMGVKKVLFVAPGHGNGGIRSWAKKMLMSFCNDEYELIHIGVAYRRALRGECGLIRRVFDGLLDLLDTRNTIKSKLIQQNDIKIAHITTSGSLGTLSDYVIGKLCKRNGVKTILHCHYGCIKEDYTKKGPIGILLRKTMKLYDQIWVLDTVSFNILSANSMLAGKVHITPNSIHVPTEVNIVAKKYEKIAFVGNLVPTKGLYELIEAIKQCAENTTLTIIGPGKDSVISHIKQLGGELIDKRIKIIGALPNEQAIEMIKSMDIIALPTYYQSEAFPISILEAMSYGKMVISTPRAAIKDMLTAIDGSECGYLVRERYVEDIAEAIMWCQSNPELADERCKKAYDKVYSCYRTDVIYELYRNLYKKVITE